MKRRFGIRLSLMQHIKDNYHLYIFTIASLTIGMLIGIYVVKYMDNLKKTDLAGYLKSFTQTLNVNSIDYQAIFMEAVKNNIPLIILIAILGVTFIGVPIILFIDVIKGFTIGFTISFMINSMGYKGIGVVLAGIVPQNIIYIPCFVLSSVIALSISLDILKRKINKRINLNKNYSVGSYILSNVFIILLMFIGFTIEAFLTPNLIKLIVINNGVLI